MTDLEAVATRVAALEQAHHELNDRVEENTRITAAIKSDTADLVEFTRNAKGVVTLGHWIGRCIAWLAPIVAVVVGVWATFKGHKQ